MKNYFPVSWIENRENRFKEHCDGLRRDIRGIQQSLEELNALFEDAYSPKQPRTRRVEHRSDGLTRSATSNRERTTRSERKECRSESKVLFNEYYQPDDAPSLLVRRAVRRESCVASTMTKNKVRHCKRTFDVEEKLPPPLKIASNDRSRPKVSRSEGEIEEAAVVHSKLEPAGLQTIEETAINGKLEVVPHRLIEQEEPPPMSEFLLVDEQNHECEGGEEENKEITFATHEISVEETAKIEEIWRSTQILFASKIKEENWEEEHQISIEEDDENIEGLILVAGTRESVKHGGLKCVKREEEVKCLGLRENFRYNPKTLNQLQMGHIFLMGQDYLLGQTYLRGGLSFLFLLSIVLFPLWIWEILRRDFSVGVYHSGRGEKCFI